MTVLSLCVGFAVAGPATGPHLMDRSLDEVSGMVPRTQGGFWVVEDGGNPAAITAVGPQGERIGRVRISGVDNVDWEDLAAVVSTGGRRTLLVADVGDNDARRESVTVYAVPEAALAVMLPRGAVPTIASWTVTLEGGPADVEAVGVDPRTRRLVLVSKRATPPEVYVASLAEPGAVMARRVGVLRIPAPSAEVRAERPFGRFRGQPTALDVRADGALMVQTYGDLFVFAPEADGWATEPARRIAVPPLAQTEAGCLGQDGAWWVTTEGRPAPLVRVSLSAD